MQSVHQYWHELTGKSLFCQFIDVILRSYGQVMLQNNPLSGLIFLVGVLLGGYSTGKPETGLTCLLAVTFANAAAYLYQLNFKAWQQGIYGFNACLIGIALPTFCESSLYLWCSIVLAAILSVFITQAFNTILQQWCLPCLTMPFVLTVWIFILATPSLSAFTLYSATTSVAPTSSYNLLQLIPDSILGIAEVFLFNSMLAGAVFLTGLAVNSLRMAICALAGSVLAIGTAILYGGQIDIISLGLYSFNAILTAITLATFSNNLNVKTSLYIAFGIILTVFTQAALTTLLKPFAIPVLTMPFILVSWLWLLFYQTLNQR